MATAVNNDSVVSVGELLHAGVHFGHQTRRWNPKMKRFIFGERNGIYIIDVASTLKGIEQAYTYTRDLVADGGTIMFVSTKRQMTETTKDAAERCNMPYVNYRWLGGMLTNFSTMKGRIDYLRELEAMESAGVLDAMKKKEALTKRRERAKLERYLGGMRDLDDVPDAIWVIDTKKEHIAVTEAKKKGVTVVATLDTNCDPDEVDFGIPANDDAIRAGILLSRIIADAVIEGRSLRDRGMAPGTRRRHDDEDELEREIKRAQAEADAQAYERERARQESLEALKAREDAEKAAISPAEEGAPVVAETAVVVDVDATPEPAGEATPA